MKRKHAWLITWETLQRGEVTDVVDGQVVAFLNSRLSGESVRQIMKSLWISCGRLTWEERLQFSTGKIQPTFFLSDLQGIYVGLKPRLFGRIVENIDVTDHEDGGCVTWIETIYGKRDEISGRHQVTRRKVQQVNLPLQCEEKSENQRQG